MYSKILVLSDSTFWYINSLNNVYYIQTILHTPLKAIENRDLNFNYFWREFQLLLEVHVKQFLCNKFNPNPFMFPIPHLFSFPPLTSHFLLEGCVHPKSCLVDGSNSPLKCLGMIRCLSNDHGLFNMTLSWSIMSCE